MRTTPKTLTHSFVALSAALMMSSGLSGCATVNLNEVARPKTATVKAEQNVVQRAASALASVFRDRGFVPNTSRKRLQSAASVLLNGLEEPSSVQVAGETTQVKSADMVISDIAFAKGYVDRTVAAAEIYFEVAPVNRDLREELTSLEQALIASDKAQSNFDMALQNNTQAELVAFNASVENLREITNEFGARVRLRDTEKLALLRANSRSNVI